MCILHIDARAYLARVTFDANDNLGVLYNGYTTGQTITIQEGTVLDLTVYNAKDEGTLDFKFVFTGGLRLTAVVLTTLSSLALATLS